MFLCSCAREFTYENIILLHVTSLLFLLYIAARIIYEFPKVIHVYKLHFLFISYRKNVLQHICCKKGALGLIGLRLSAVSLSET